MTAERNTIYEMVSDLESDICDMEGYASLLQLAAVGVMQHHSKEAGDGLIRLATDTEACVDRLREWHRKPHAAVGGQDDPWPTKPANRPKEQPVPTDPETRWRKLRGRWLAMQAEWAAGDFKQERADQLTEEEGPLVLAMVATPVTGRFLEEKLEVLDYVMFHDRASSWIDRRDELLLNSIKADVKALG